MLGRTRARRRGALLSLLAAVAVTALPPAPASANFGGSVAHAEATSDSIPHLRLSSGKIVDPGLLSIWFGGDDGEVTADVFVTCSRNGTTRTSSEHFVRRTPNTSTPYAINSPMGGAHVCRVNVAAHGDAPGTISVDIYASLRPPQEFFQDECGKPKWAKRGEILIHDHMGLSCKRAALIPALALKQGPGPRGFVAVRRWLCRVGPQAVKCTKRDTIIRYEKTPPRERRSMRVR